MSSDEQCFVVSAIGQPGSRERKHADLVFNYIIRPVAEKAGYRVERGDQSRHSGMITVDIINSLMDAKLVIADLSFLNPNVFYELGVRHSVRRATIHLASHDTQVPFDNADHRAIIYDIGDWDSHQRTHATLRHHIESIETRDVMNPVTVALTHKSDARLSRIIDSVGLVLAKLEERISHIPELPLKGAVTREFYQTQTETYRDDILQIVKAIRQRIDQRPTDTTVEHPPQAVDMLRRLNKIEQIVLQDRAVHLLPANTTTQ